MTGTKWKSHEILGRGRFETNSNESGFFLRLVGPRFIQNLKAKEAKRKFLILKMWNHKKLVELHQPPTSIKRRKKFADKKEKEIKIKGFDFAFIFYIFFLFFSQNLS